MMGLPFQSGLPTLRERATLPCVGGSARTTKVPPFFPKPALFYSCEIATRGLLARRQVRPAAAGLLTAGLRPQPVLVAAPPCLLRADGPARAESTCSRLKATKAPPGEACAP